MTKFVQPSGSGARDITVTMTMDEWLLVVAVLKDAEVMNRKDADYTQLADDVQHCYAKIEQHLV